MIDLNPFLAPEPIITDQDHPGCITFMVLQLLSINLSCTIMFSYSIDIPLASNALFTVSIHPIHDLFGLVPLTSDVGVFSKLPPAILYTCPNHHSIPCSARSLGFRTTPVYPCTNHVLLVMSPSWAVFISRAPSP